MIAGCLQLPMIQTRNEVNPSGQQPRARRVAPATGIAHRLLRQGAATSIQSARLSQALGWWVPSDSLRRGTHPSRYAA